MRDCYQKYIRERLIFTNTDSKVSAEELYGDFISWSKNNPTPNLTNFIHHMMEYLGCTFNKCWLGLEIKPQ